MTRPDVEPGLGDLLHHSQPSAELQAYAVDGVVPALVVRPRSQSELLELLTAARERGAGVVPWGSGSHMDLGMPPTRYDVALDMTALRKVVEYEPADLTVSIEAGMRLADLQSTLAENGQWLPLDPPGPSAMTIGGMLAANASGPGRVVHGTARDLLIGLFVANPAGELLKSGGRVVKNVAGYDIGKLHIGALGTLGVIAQASFKVAPLPEAMRTVEAVSANATTLSSVAAFARRKGLAVNRLAVVRPAGATDWRLLVRLAGGAAATNASMRQLTAEAGDQGVAFTDADEATWNALPALEAGAGVRVRAGVQPTASPAIMTELVRLNANVVAYPTVGIVYGSWGTGSIRPEALLALRRQCVEAGRGALVIEKAPVELKRAVDVWGDARSDLPIMRRLKAQFDPDATLSPGRFVAGI